jgi:hypothetical protein
MSALFLSSTSIQVAQAAIIGDPGIVYDPSGKVDDFYEPKQQEWAKAGVVGGIRDPSSDSIEIVLGASTETIQSQINDFSDKGGGVVKFPAGTWEITNTLRVPKNIVLEGLGDVSILKDVLDTNNNNNNTKGKVLMFYKLTAQNGHMVGGIRKMQLLGPSPDDGTLVPTRNNFQNAEPNYVNNMVNFVRSENLFLDQVTILNSGNSAFSTWNSGAVVGHYTIRNCNIDGAWNKGGGGRGYFNIQSGYCLVYNNTIKNLRHFAFQNQGAKYNVVYGNNINIDVNFHNDDGGNNLIEKNTITIDRGIVGGRYAVMGPWSHQHDPSRADNYVYNNVVTEAGRTDPRCEHPGFVYKGARGYEPNKQPGNNPFSTKEWIDRDKRMYSVQ